MKHIDGLITDGEVEKSYISFDTPGVLGFHYSSDALSGTNVRTYIRSLPSFEDVYYCFLACNDSIFKRNKTQDICLSLFYQPYFTEFYERFKQDVTTWSKERKRAIKKYLLEYLASDAHYKGIMEFDVGGQSLRQFYIEKDICNKSQELMRLMKS